MGWWVWRGDGWEGHRWLGRARLVAEGRARGRGLTGLPDDGLGMRASGWACELRLDAGDRWQRQTRGLVDGGAGRRRPGRGGLPNEAREEGFGKVLGAKALGATGFGGDGWLGGSGMGLAPGPGLGARPRRFFSPHAGGTAWDVWPGAGPGARWDGPAPGDPRGPTLLRGSLGAPLVRSAWSERVGVTPDRGGCSIRRLPATPSRRSAGGVGAWS